MVVLCIAAPEKTLFCGRRATLLHPHHCQHITGITNEPSSPVRNRLLSFCLSRHESKNRNLSVVPSYGFCHFQARFVAMMSVRASPDIFAQPSIWPWRNFDQTALWVSNSINMRPEYEFILAAVKVGDGLTRRAVERAYFISIKSSQSYSFDGWWGGSLVRRDSCKVLSLWRSKIWSSCSHRGK